MRSAWSSRLKSFVILNLRIDTHRGSRLSAIFHLCVTQTENNPTLQQTNASSCRSAPNVAVHPVAVHPVAIEAVGNNNGVEAVDLAHPEIEIVTVDAVAKTQTKTKTKTKGAGATSPGTRTAFTGTKIVLNANRIVEEN